MMLEIEMLIYFIVIGFPTIQRSKGFNVRVSPKILEDSGSTADHAGKKRIMYEFSNNWMIQTYPSNSFYEIIYVSTKLGTKGFNIIFDGTP